MELTIIGFLMFIACVLLGFVLSMFISWKNFTDKKISELTNKIMAKDLNEYALLKSELETTPKDRISEMKVENKLAMSAAEIERRINEERISGRPV